MSDTSRSATRRTILTAAGALATTVVAGCLGEGSEDGSTATDHDTDHAADDHEDDHVHDEDDDHVHEEDDDRDLAVSNFALETEGGDVVADIHGDHWHGSIEVAPGEELTLVAVAEAEDGERLDVGGELEVEASPVDGSTVSIDFEERDDRIDVTGNDEGFVDVIVRLIEDGEPVYESPKLEAVVRDDG